MNQKVINFVLNDTFNTSINIFFLILFIYIKLLVFVFRRCWSYRRNRRLLIWKVSFQDYYWNGARTLLHISINVVFLNKLIKYLSLYIFFVFIKHNYHFSIHFFKVRYIFFITFTYHKISRFIYIIWFLINLDRQTVTWSFSWCIF